MTPLYSFLSGLVVALSAVAAAFFVRFYRRSGDSLFLLFAAAFLVMACGWTVLAFLPVTHEARPYAYLLRLFGFGLIIAGIVYKNRSSR